MVAPETVSRTGDGHSDRLELFAFGPRQLDPVAGLDRFACFRFASKGVWD
jgi:hypothetical protein